MKTFQDIPATKNNAESAVGEPRITSPNLPEHFSSAEFTQWAASRLANLPAALEQPKFCKDCAYFTEPFKSRPRCAHPLVPKEDLIYGDNRRCEDARNNLLKNNCGGEAAFFTAKTDIPSNTPS